MSNTSFPAREPADTHAEALQCQYLTSTVPLASILLPHLMGKQKWNQLNLQQSTQKTVHSIALNFLAEGQERKRERGPELSYAEPRFKLFFHFTCCLNFAPPWSSLPSFCLGRGQPAPFVLLQVYFFNHRPTTPVTTVLRNGLIFTKGWTPCAKYTSIP